MATKAISVQITGEYNNRDVNRAIKDLELLKTGGTGTTGAMGGLSNSIKALGGVMAATFSVGMIADFFADSVKAFIEDEEAARKLAQTMTNLGFERATDQVEGMINAQQRLTGQADNVLRPAFARLIRSTKDVEDASEALRIAQDISAGTGRDLESVASALGKAYDGNVVALGRLGLGLDTSLLKTKDMEKILGELSTSFEGQAAASAGTYAGKIKLLNVAVDEGKELIGGALLGAVEDISDAFGGVGGLTGAIDTASQAMADFITGAATGLSPLADLITGLTGSADTTLDFADALKIAYPIFYPLIQQVETLVDAGAALRVGNVQQAKATTKLKDEYITASGAIVGFVAAEFEAEDAVADTTNSLLKQFAAMSMTNVAMQDAGTRGIYNAVADDNLRLDAAAAAAAKSISGLGGSSGGAAKDLFTFKEALAEVNSAGLEKLNANLQAAQDEFDGFRKSVSAGISGQLDFGTAVDEAKKGGTGIVAGIVSQADGIVAFGKQLQELLKTSLSEEAFTAVAALTAERGAGLATELLGANGATLIANLNSSVLAVNAIADAVALESATKFKGAGVTTAQATIDGFTEFMGKDGIGRARLMKTMDNLADAATRQARIDVLVTRSITEVVTQIRQTTTGLQARAAGGPVRAGGSYIVGEAGPELFTPSRSGGITPNGAMGGNTYQITVQAGVGDPRAIGQQVVEYIKKFEKANGPVFTAA